MYFQSSVRDPPFLLFHQTLSRGKSLRCLIIFLRSHSYVTKENYITPKFPFEISKCFIGSSEFKREHRVWEHIFVYICLYELTSAQFSNIFILHVKNEHCGASLRAFITHY